MNSVIKFLTVSLTALSIFATLPASAKVPNDKLEEVERRKKERGGQVLGQRVGKKIGAAFELYSEDKVNEALELLLEIEPKGAFDKAYVDRFIGNMYAGIEGKAPVALERLKKAKKADVLPFTDHAATIKLIADLSLQERDFETALKHYQEFLDFSLDEDPTTYLRMANVLYEMKEYDKAIKPARRAIELFETPNQNPYIIIMASYYESKKYKEATKAVEDLVKVFPENPKWWTQLGSFYMTTEDYERGLSTLELAYKQGFLETENQIKQLAQLYSTNGIPYKSAVVQEKHLKEGLIKKSRQSLSVLASTYRNAKEFAKAAEYYGQAAQLANDGDLYKDQGNMLLALEKNKEAVVAYNKALDAGVERKGVVYMAIAEAHFYQRQWKQAHKAIKLAMKEKNTAKSAASWEAYIREAAERDGVKL
ncbi:tetratricopeptide repeat protein [Psychrosphaera aestuarii]|uniref:tetratricopeptide repeat protein n=1 Tax=Psychrosphaera aestuarii TaxID=1266052 RepID=UPI001B3341A8|nr:tetratricopeptide repeat protein [Psychrosphaera aestuarii]